MICIGTVWLRTMRILVTAATGDPKRPPEPLYTSQSTTNSISRIQSPLTISALSLSPCQSLNLPLVHSVHPYFMRHLVERSVVMSMSNFQPTWLIKSRNECTFRAQNSNACVLSLYETDWLNFALTIEGRVHNPTTPSRPIRTTATLSGAKYHRFWTTTYPIADHHPFNTTPSPNFQPKQN